MEIRAIRGEDLGMGMSSATYSSLDPTDLDNVKNPLGLTGKLACSSS
jgi:hypothetical protein